ncbi:MAG: hypothetical protein WA741_08350 [Candidatus Sulfotelmatobacter sp.]
MAGISVINGIQHEFNAAGDTELFEDAGPQRGELEALAASLRLSNVEFVGQVGQLGRTARDRIAAPYQWQKIAEDIEKTYFTILGSQLESAPIKKPSVLAAAAGAREGSERRAG